MHAPLRSLRPALIALTVAAVATVPLATGSGADAAAKLNGTTATTLGSHRAEFTFNVPGNKAEITKAIALINGAPKGATIRMAIHSFSRTDVYDALARAKKRGVSIYAVHSGDKRHGGQYKASDGRVVTAYKLAKLLGSSRFHWCDHGTKATTAAKDKGGCLSTAAGGIMHAKYMLLSTTKDSSGTTRKNVVWYTSSNFTDGSGVDLFNNSTTIYGDATLYSGFLKHAFNPMWAEKSYAGNDYYDADAPRGYFGSQASNAQAYLSPEQQYDLVNTRLNYVIPTSACRVRVMENTLHGNRGQVISKLVGFRKGGCKVWVVAESLDRAAYDKLHAAGVQIHQAKVHDKTFVINARYDSSGLRTVVLNGSHNITDSALRKNDELLVKLTDNTTMYNAYVRHFNDAYNLNKVMGRPKA